MCVVVVVVFLRFVCGLYFTDLTFALVSTRCLFQVTHADAVAALQEELQKKEVRALAIEQLSC